MRAFADGFGGGLTGGLIYSAAHNAFHPTGLEFAWLRILALSVTFGGFEIWRVTENRTFSSVRLRMLWTLLIGLTLLQAVEAFLRAG